MDSSRFENRKSQQKTATPNLAWTKSPLLREKQWVSRRLASAAFVSLVCYGLASTPLQAAPDETWDGVGNNWNLGTNWLTNGVPTNSATFDTALPTTIIANSNTIINSLIFVPTASQYTFTNSSNFSVNGTGFENRSLFVQRFNNTGTLSFNNAASAAPNFSVLFTNNFAGRTVFNGNTKTGVAQFVNNFNGITTFNATSSAQAALITNNLGGSTVFNNDSTAGNSLITNNLGGTTTFNNKATAATSTINVNALSALTFNNSAKAGTATITGATGSFTTFNNDSSAENATINNAGVLTFNNNATADEATISSTGALAFTGNSTAGDATITNTGGLMGFAGTSDAGTSQITNSGGLGFSGTASAENSVISNTGAVAFIVNSTLGDATVFSNNNVVFAGNSSAGTGELNNSGALNFNNTSNAQNAVINNTLTGVTTFSDTSTANLSTITNSAGGKTNFNGTSDAANAVIINQNSGGTFFNASSLGGTSLIENQSGGVLDISGHNGALTVGETYGAGNIFLGANNLTTGQNANRVISGVIADGDSNGDLNAGIGGSLTKVGTGKLTLSNDNTFAGLTTVTQGELAIDGSVAGNVNVGTNGRLSGSGTVVGNLSNSGIIAPGSVLSPLANLSVLGDYADSPDSVFETRTSGAPVLPGNFGAASGLTVFGGADLAGATVRVRNNGGLYGMQTRYRVVSTIEGRSGLFNSVVDESDLPDYLDATLDQSALNVDLLLTRNATDFADNTSDLTPNQRATALSLDAGVGFIDDSLFPTYDALIFAPSDEIRRQGLNIVSGDALSAFPFLANQAANRFSERMISQKRLRSNNVVTARIDTPKLKQVAYNTASPRFVAQNAVTSSTRSSAQLSPSASDVSRSNVWAIVGGSRDDADSDGNGPGFDARNRDYQIGYERRTNNRNTFGLSLGKSDGDVKVPSRDASGDIDTTSIGAYIHHENDDSLYFTGQLSYSRHNIESRRELLVDGIATADYDAKTLSIGGEIGKRYLKEKYSVEPHVTLRLANTRVDGFEESGGAGALSVDDSRFNSRRVGVGVRVMGADNTAKFRPHLSLSLERELGDTRAEITNNVTGVGAFDVDGSDLSKNIFRASIGAEAQIGERLSLVAEAGIARRKNQDSRSIYGGLKFGF